MAVPSIEAVGQASFRTMRHRREPVETGGVGPKDWPQDAGFNAIRAYEERANITRNSTNVNSIPVSPFTRRGSSGCWIRCPRHDIVNRGDDGLMTVFIRALSSSPYLPALSLQQLLRRLFPFLC